MRCIANAFSLQMLGDISKLPYVDITVSQMNIDEVKTYLLAADFESCIGHADTARILTSMLGIEIPVNRKSVTLGANGIVVAQVIGGRLPEGATELPAGMEIKFYFVCYTPVTQ